MYKSGYTKGLRVPKNEKVNSDTYEQEGYHTFGFKAFAAEKMPSSHKAKGLKERIVQLKCTYGIPEYDIVEIINNADDPIYKALLKELNDLKNRLLIYRLLHYHEPIPSIKTELLGREKQLWNPLLRVFQNNKTTFDILKKVAVEYLNEYRQEKSHTQTALLLRMISRLIKEKEGSHTLQSSEIWKKYKELLYLTERRSARTLIEVLNLVTCL
jgi:hypothetical protein